jgi:hypothetical protein
MLNIRSRLKVLSFLFSLQAQAQQVRETFHAVLTPNSNGAPLPRNRAERRTFARKGIF